MVKIKGSRKCDYHLQSLQHTIGCWLPFRGFWDTPGIQLTVLIFRKQKKVYILFKCSWPAFPRQLCDGEGLYSVVLVFPKHNQTQNNKTDLFEILEYILCS